MNKFSIGQAVYVKDENDVNAGKRAIVEKIVGPTVTGDDLYQIHFDGQDGSWDYPGSVLKRW